MSDPKDKPQQKAGPVWARPGTVAAAVLIVAVAAAAVALGLGAFDEDDPAPDSTGQATSAAPDSDAGDGSGEPLTAAPTGVAWEVESGVLLPVSETAGPTDVDDSGVPTGFAHSPEGALVATVQIIARSEAPFDAAARRAVITAGFDAGPDRDALLAAVDDGAAPPAAADIAIVAGFVMHAYSADAAVVELVMDAGEGRYISFMTDLVWDETASTWLVVPPAGGDWSRSVRELPSLDGVIVWGP